MNKIRNETIKEQLEEPSVLDKIERCKMKWYGYMKRKERGRIATA